jgi:hypothetical protein
VVAIDRLLRRGNHVRGWLLMMMQLLALESALDASEESTDTMQNADGHNRGTKCQDQTQPSHSKSAPSKKKKKEKEKENAWREKIKEMRWKKL